MESVNVCAHFNVRDSKGGGVQCLVKGVVAACVSSPLIVVSCIHMYVYSFVLCICMCLHIYECMDVHMYVCMYNMRVCIY